MSETSSASEISNALSSYYTKSETSSSSEIMSAMNSKLEQTAAAPEFSTLSSYMIYDYVTYNGMLYRFNTLHAAGDSWDLAEVDAVDMTEPDATLDITRDNKLRVMAADGT